MCFVLPAPADTATERIWLLQNGETLSASEVRRGVPGVNHIRAGEMAGRYKNWVRNCIDKFDEQASSQHPAACACDTCCLPPQTCRQVALLLLMLTLILLKLTLLLLLLKVLPQTEAWVNHELLLKHA